MLTHRAFRAAAAAARAQWRSRGGGAELSGDAELLVFRDDDGVSAIVRLIDLQVRRGDQSIVMNTTFVANTP